MSDTAIVVRLNGLEHDKSVVDRLVSANLEWKLDKYVTNKQLSGELVLSQEKDGKFTGVLRGKVDHASFHFSRTFVKLDDLVNHLFDHLKQQQSSAH